MRRSLMERSFSDLDASWELSSSEREIGAPIETVTRGNRNGYFGGYGPTG